MSRSYCAILVGLAAMVCGPSTQKAQAAEFPNVAVLPDDTAILPTLVATQDVRSIAGVDQFIRLDAATGVAVAVGSLGSGFKQTDAIAVQHAQLPTIAGIPLDRVFAADSDRLLEIDPLTGAGHLIGPIGFSHVDGLAFRPFVVIGTGKTQEASPVLYGVTYGSNKLLSIDITTGHGTVIASHVLEGHRLNDLAFHPDGRLFIITNDSRPKLFQVDPLTGKKIKEWTLSGAHGLESLLFSPDGSKLYSTADRGGSTDLCTIDLTTSTVTFVNPSLHSGFDDIEDLAWMFLFDTFPDKPEPAAGQPLPVQTPRVATVRLYPNTPNPFNPSTRIEFDLLQTADVDLGVVDVRGRRVASLLRGRTEAGHHTVSWAGRSDSGEPVASGVYFYTLTALGKSETRRMVLAK